MKLELEIRHYNCPKEKRGDTAPMFKVLTSPFIGIEQLRCPECDTLITIKLQTVISPEQP